MKLFKKVMTLGLASIMALSIASCGRQEKYADALRIGSTEIPKTLMPYASSDTANMYICGLMYDTLLGTAQVPKGYTAETGYTFADGKAYEAVDSSTNYYLFTDGLFKTEGAYPKKAGSKYGFEFYTPTKEEYDKQLSKKNLIQGYDESGVKIEETDEEFKERCEETVPSDNWMRYRFEVDTRYTWNDGQPFTADDVVFTFKYVMKYSGKLASIAFFLSSYYNCYNDNGDFVLELATHKLSDIKTICNSIFILPKHIWQTISNPTEFNNMENPVGTGAYKLEAEGTVSDQSICLKYRDDFNKELEAEMFAYSPITHIFMEKVGNEDVMLNSLNQGDIDVALSSLSSTKVHQIKSSGKYANVNIATSDSSFITTLCLNCGDNGIFNSKNNENADKLREAISLGLDQNKLIEQYLYGDGDTVGDGLVKKNYTHALKDASGNYVDHNYNVEKANEILDSLGYTKDASGKRNLNFKVLALQHYEVLINLISSVLEESIGVTLTFQQASTGTYSEDIKQRNNPTFDMIINSVSFDIDQLLMFDARFGTYSNGSARVWNISGTNDSELSALMKTMDTCLTISEQYAQCNKVQERLAQLHTEIPLFTSKTYSVYQTKKYEGFVETETGTILNSYTMRYLKLKK